MEIPIGPKAKNAQRAHTWMISGVSSNVVPALPKRVLPFFVILLTFF